jgi:2-oxo-4-hydroxy-4-carboxy--5-ureidoimidazoline (OHCU) decarboxylase
MARSLPDVTQLPTLTQAEQIRALDLLFEPSPAIHNTLLPALQTETFASYDQMIIHCHGLFTALATDDASSSRAVLHSILGSHPRLGAKKVESDQSAAEQAKLQAGGDATELAALNAEYEARYPGLRFVTFVNGRDRSEIMADMRMRLARGDFALEEIAAIDVSAALMKNHSILIRLRAVLNEPYHCDL